ncbi:MAG: cell division protein ZipA C-terminal FtsZ-binding domain-containing protein [Gammaproteobacteria bacterium]|nr:cell division protein ZipA C-terminal FtsZ-binding domain-containing protein [Gammaproteobacteria bacterium]
MSFIIVLGAIIFILCAVGICLLIRQPSKKHKQSKYHQNKFKPLPKQKSKKFKRKKIKDRTNGYQKSAAPKIEPRLGSSPFDMDGNDETDVVLGLRETESAEPDEKPKAKQFNIDSVIGERKLIVFYLRAEEGRPYAGYELLQSLLSADLRFGDMDIFHHAGGFSLASITPPGTFDMDKMGSFSCTGLSLFLSLESCEDPLTSFQSMLHTADQLVQDLGGKVLDEGQNLLTEEKVLQLYQELQNAYV